MNKYIYIKGVQEWKKILLDNDENTICHRRSMALVDWLGFMAYQPW